MEDLIIIGAGGAAKEVAFLLEQINRLRPMYNILGFAELSDINIGKMVGKYRICYKEDDLLEKDHLNLAIGIGDPKIIEKVAKKLSQNKKLKFPNLIHPGTIWDADRLTLGKGNIVTAGNIFTTDIKIGSFNYLNRSSTYGHDLNVGDYCVINPGVNISGGVNIDSGCLIGTGCTILQCKDIGRNSIIAAGSVVTKNVPSGVTVYGVPAKEKITEYRI
ncbi:MAG: NeuD/PglB/VioB family sugar acetyltransferase [Oligoflexales bacterium]